MRLLVTGSSGLIGREVVALLRAQGAGVVPFDIADGQDICRPADLSRAMAGCDGILHLAAISRVAWGEQAPALCHHVNVTGTQILLDTARTQPQQPWLVFASSREVYGDPDHIPVTEAADIRPLNHYGKSKAAGERLVATSGLRNAMLRLSNVYGTVHDHPDRAVPSLLWRAMAGADLRLTGADAFFDFVHVDDTARGLVAAALRLAGGSDTLPPLHLATGIATTLGELARLSVAVTHSASGLTLLPARRFDVRGFCGDPAHAAQILGWAAKIPLAEGLQAYHAILRAHGRAPDPVQMPAMAAE